MAGLQDPAADLRRHAAIRGVGGEEGPPWVVLPTYDEAATVGPVVEGLLRHAEVRVLVVDDASPDGTGAVADRIAAREARVEVLHRPRREGLRAAYAAGFDHALGAGAGHVLEMDADGSHDPADVARLLDAAAAGGGAHLVLGSRYVPGGGIDAWTRSRRLLSRAGNGYARVVLGVPIRDLTSGFKCFDARALRALDHGSACSEGYAFQVELTYRALRAGMRVREVPIVFGDRRHGRSKMTWGIAVEAAWRVPLLRARG